MIKQVQLDVESLRTFIAVLDHGGMTSAARQLGLSQSAVSWKIKRLEQRVDRTLLLRDGQTLRPSRDGRALLDDARDIVAIHDRAVSRLRTTELAGVVKLGADTEVEAEPMTEVLGCFRRTHPAVKIELQLGSTDQIRTGIDSGDFDVAIIQVTDDDLRPEDTILWTDRLIWVASAEHPNEDEIDPVSLVTFGEQCFYRTVSEPLLDGAGIEYSVGLSVATTSSVRSAVAAGLGIGVIGSRYLTEDLVEWRRGAELGELPLVHQVARTVPGERPDVATGLASVLISELSSNEQSLSVPTQT